MPPFHLWMREGIRMSKQMAVEANAQGETLRLPGILLVFFAPLAVYIATLCPTVYGGDSGELIAAAYSLGIAHVPGHPLYVLIGKLFSFLPLGNIAYRLNFMSAFFAALALGSLFVLQNLLFVPVGKYFSTPSLKFSLPSQGKGGHEGELPSFERTILAVLAVLAFGFSETFWHYATTAETYTGGIFFFALLYIR